MSTRTRLLLLLLLPGLLAPPSVTASDPHAGHGPAPAAAPEHVHPVAEPAAEVGLDERPGALLPLDLILRDEEGAPVRLADLVQGPTLILPVYYRCPNVCSFLQAGVAEAITRVKRTPGSDFRILSISFNERESVQDAQKARMTYLYITGEGFPPEAWRFLTGEAATVRALFEAAGYRYTRQGEDFLHPVASFVISGKGQIVRYLHGTRPLPKDLTLAFYEAETGRVGATIRSLVQFCFSYDPEGQTYVLNLLRISASVILVCLALFLTFLIRAGKRRPSRKDPKP